MILKLHNHSPLGKRCGGNDSFGFFGAIQDLPPVIHDFVAADQDVGVKADNLSLELAFKPGHHRDHNDQHADPKHHAQDRDQSDQRKKSALRLQIPQREKIGERQANLFGHRSENAVCNVIG